jgi:glutathione-regulated potassium-efflux system ancillary protein KefC
MELNSFVLSAVLLLFAASIAVALFKHLGLGSVLGLLVAGIIVGPHSPGPYVTTHVEDVRHFTELGVVLLLFLIGLEMKPGRLWALRRNVFGLGSLQILLSGIAIAAYVSLYQASWKTALLIGLTLALSSTAFVVQLLQERGEMASRYGSTAFAVLLMQDLAIVPLLALVPILSDTGALSSAVPLWEQVVIVAGMLGLVWGFGRYLLPFALDRLSRQNNREGFFMVVMLAVFIAAWAMHQAGLSMALGAFMMGMLLSGSRYSLQIQALVEPYKGLLMSLFFVAVGMSIDLDAIGAQPGLFAQHTLVIVAIKVVILFLLALVFGLSRIDASRVALMLAQGGEFGFVLFSSAKALRVIDDATFMLAISVISVSMLMTPVLVKAGDAMVRRAGRTRSEGDEYRYHAEHGESGARVILGGYGRVGHTVATLLQSSGVPFIAFDTNPAHVTRGKADGFPVYYGDIGDLELLTAAGAQHATLVVLTIDHSATALRAISHLRINYPNLPVIARARDLKDAGDLLQAGATQAFPEAIESSLALGANALNMVGVPVENVDLLLQGVRKENYKLVRPTTERTP